MGRGFSNKTKISRHNVSFIIHPDKSIINAMNWKIGDIVEIIPIPEKGIICLKGRKISNQKFTKRFYLELIKKINIVKAKKISKKLKTMITRFYPLDIIAYKHAFAKLWKLDKQIENIVKTWQKFLNEEDKKIRKEFDIPIDKYS